MNIGYYLKRKLLLTLIYPVVLWFWSFQQSNALSLDDYCLSKLPLTKRQPRTKYGLIKLLLVCSNLEMYQDCLLSTRPIMEGVDIHFFEKYFPSAYDVQRAGYLFCAEEIPNHMASYMVREDDIIKCESMVDVSRCGAGEELMGRWNFAQDASNNTAMQSISCQASVDYYECLSSQYSQCNATFAAMFTYYFTRLGPECLIARHKPNNIVLIETCRDDLNDAMAVRSWPQFVLIPMLALLNIWFYCAVLSCLI